MKRLYIAISLLMVMGMVLGACATHRLRRQLSRPSKCLLWKPRWSRRPK